ncbi:receptor kinase-like protein Xa21 [Camellia sinensis]|uniref:receptor kinase-like protein Xa21 n=1 Tax=Camellia sinensis TaxID=4442 RepID=UPI001035A846|nr:receptor kinase-like protein Xa21 [Camellia sinensis]
MNLGNLHDLQVFSIYDNLFGVNRGELMNFLTSLSNCSKLRALELSKNHFEGSLTHSIVNLSTKLNSLLFDTNYIFGIIPPWIENLASLWLLGLAENKLTGSIPDSIGKLSKLEELYIYTNNISGKIPSSIRNLSRLNTFFLSNNMLEGSMPISMGNCTNLQNIELGYNHLTGAIFGEIVSLSSLSILFSIYHNYLVGQLPSQVGNLFEGTIPASFKRLKGTQVLDLSLNNLSGHILRFLGEFTLIYDLNLSYNKFEGEVPSE